MVALHQDHKRRVVGGLNGDDFKRAWNGSAKLREGTVRWVCAHPILTGILAPIIALFLIGVMLTPMDEADDSSNDDKSAGDVSTSWKVPDLAGKRLDKANKALADAGAPENATDLRDMAPRRRNIGGAEHWNVIDTVAGPGKVIASVPRYASAVSGDPRRSDPMNAPPDVAYWHQRRPRVWTGQPRRGHRQARRSGWVSCSSTTSRTRFSKSGESKQGGIAITPTWTCTPTVVMISTYRGSCARHVSADFR